MGLKPKHHGELNKCGISRSRFAELRREYKNDGQALQQIDVYDPQSAYQPKFRELSIALRGGNKEKEKELMEWFNKFYPDI